MAVVNYNFRSTSGYVTDGSGNFFVTHTSAYSSGVGYGWVSTTGLDSRDRNSGTDPRLAGIVFRSNNGSQNTFRVDLPGTGLCDVGLALGDYGSPSNVNAYVYDDSTLIATLELGDTGAGQYWFDANGTLRTSVAAWTGSQVKISHTFVSSILKVVIGNDESGSGNCAIANVSVDYFGPSTATAYTLTGPAGDLTRNTESGNFTVTPNGEADGDIVVTPSDGGAGGVFNPTSVTFSDGDDSAKTFKYTPRAAGGASVTISVTNDGGLTDPADVTKDVVVALTQFRITGTPTLFVAGSADYVIDTEQSGNIS